MSPDTVIVTLRNSSGTFETDYELSAHSPVEQLSQLLLEGLVQQNPALFGKWKGLSFLFEGYRLQDQDTLSDLGIWDGKILTIEEAQV